MLTQMERGFLARAIELSRQGIEQGIGGPFGCVVVRDGCIIGEAGNMVTSLNDPTAHAEVMAIRRACTYLGDYQLTDCDIYTSCEPCPMCLGAIYWARPRRVVYANTREDAAKIAFDDAFIYEEINAVMKDRRIPFQHEPDPQAKEVFLKWAMLKDKKEY